MKNARRARWGDVIMAGMTVRRIFLAALPSVFALVIFGFGFAADRYQMARSLRRPLVDSIQSDTLGHMLREDKKDNYGLVNQKPALADAGDWLHANRARLTALATKVDE